MATLSELLALHAPHPKRDPAMPQRVAGVMVRTSELPPIAVINPVQAPKPHVLGGGRARRVAPPRAIPGGVPRPAAGPHMPGAPGVPEPRPGAVPGAVPAPKIVTLYPDAFADTWKMKPPGPIEIGIRLIADGDLDRAREYAARTAAGIPGDNDDVRIEAYNETLMQWAVARATCKPEDARQDFWGAAQDTVAMALTEDGVKLLFHELMNLKIERSPLQPPATNADLLALGRLLSTASVREILTALGEARIRRHLAWLLDEVRTAVGPGHLPAETDEPDGDLEVGFPQGEVG